MIAIYSSNFKKEFSKAKQSGFKEKIEELIKTVAKNPFQVPPPYEKLENHKYRYSRRINVQHRLVYEVLDDNVRFLKCWGHYDD